MQVAQLQAEKQEVLRRCSALELDNANLQVRCCCMSLREALRHHRLVVGGGCLPDLHHSETSLTLQELVGFLSESAELSPTDGSLEVGEHDLEEVQPARCRSIWAPPLLVAVLRRRSVSSMVKSLCNVQVITCKIPAWHYL